MFYLLKISISLVKWKNRSSRLLSFCCLKKPFTDYIYIKLPVFVSVKKCAKGLTEIQTKIGRLSFKCYQTLKSLTIALSLMYTKLLLCLHTSRLPFYTCNQRRKTADGGVGRRQQGEAYQVLGLVCFTLFKNLLLPLRQMLFSSTPLIQPRNLRLRG